MANRSSFNINCEQFGAAKDAVDYQREMVKNKAFTLVAPTHNTNNETITDSRLLSRYCGK